MRPRGNRFIQSIQLYDKYARWRSEDQRRETWPEVVARVLDFLQRQPRAGGLTPTVWAQLRTALLAQDVLPSMRVVQMAGAPLDRCHVGAYNCAYTTLCGPRDVAEVLYILMQGTGVGYSVERRYISQWPTDARAKAGIFLGFQYPQEIAGVSVIQFLRQALSARKGIDLSVLELRLSAMSWMKRLGMDSTFVDRYLNEGFSGGEKKRNEIMQMAILEPDLAILDETDSGLDIDALRIVAQGIREVRKERPAMGIVLITHYQRLLDELQPDVVHILIDGKIVKSGGMELAEELEKSGYEAYR